MIRISNHAVQRILERLPIKTYDEVAPWIRENIQFAFRNDKNLYVVTAYGDVPKSVQWNPKVSLEVLHGCMQHYMTKNVWIF